MAKNKEKKLKEEGQELTRKQKIVNRVVTGVQIFLILICVVASIFIIANPGGYAENPEDCKTGMMVVMTDSMEPTIKTNDIIFGAEVPEGILDLGTVVTFAKKMNGGYILDTHRIVAYGCTYKDDDGVTKEKRFYYVKGEMENVDDIPEGYTFARYITRGDKYTFENGGTEDNYCLYTVDENGEKIINTQWDDKDMIFQEDVLAVWSGRRIGGVGSVIKFLQKPLMFALVILLPLVLLFGYNIFLIVKMVIAEKTKKAREAAIAEASANQIDEEEIKRRAIEEYLASLKKQEENKEE